MTCTASGTAVAGQYANLGTVSASPPGGLPEVTDADPSHYFGLVSSIALQKLTNGFDADSPPGPVIAAGSQVAWTYVVTSGANEDLVDVVVSDDQAEAVNCPANELAPGESMTCSATGIAVVGPYANIGTVTATPPAGPDISATDPSHYFGGTPSVTIEKRTNGHNADTAPGPYIAIGAPVTWTYEVSNTGNVTLDTISVTDNQGVVVDCDLASLDPGNSMTCTATGTAIEGQYGNIGTVTASPPGGLPAVTDSDPSHYLGIDDLIFSNGFE
jgi:hypothetical protein